MELQNLDKVCQIIQSTIDNEQKIKIVTHCDVDGLTSYTILKKTFERLNADFDIQYVPRIDSEILEYLELNEYNLILFADLGSSSLHLINDCQATHDKNIIILDHHYPIEIKPNFNLIHVNPNICGYTGDSSACGATISYLLARKFGFTDLAKYAILGAIGDLQFVNKGYLEDFNTIPIYDMKSNLVEERALQLYGKFSRPLLLALKYSSNIFSNFGESDNNILAFLHKIKRDTGIDIPYHKPYYNLTDKQVKVLARYLYGYMRLFVPKEFHKHLQSCLYGRSYHFNVDKEQIVKQPWKYDLEEIPAFLNASIRINQHDLVAKYLLSDFTESESRLLSNHRKYKRKISETIREFENLCEYGCLSNVQYYVAYQESHIEPTLSGVLAGMLYTKPEFEYTKPNVGIIEFEDGWKISMRGSKLLQFTDFHAGKLLINLSEQYGGTAGGHSLAAGAVLPYDIDLEVFLQDLNKQCIYKINN